MILYLCKMLLHVLDIIAVMYIKCCDGLFPCRLLTVHLLLYSLFVCLFSYNSFYLWKRFPRQIQLLLLHGSFCLSCYICYETYCAALWIIHTFTQTPFTPYSVDDTGEALWELYPLWADRLTKEYVFLRLFFRIATVSYVWQLLSNTCHRGSRERESRIQKGRGRERSRLLSAGYA